MRAALLLTLAATASFPQATAGVEQGRAIFRSNCAFCHGLTGTGGRGPNLVTSRLVREGADDALHAVISNGVPGTTMPAYDGFEPDDLENLVVFLRSLGRGAQTDDHVSGDPAKGRSVYLRSGCAACHRISGVGGAYGPDLTRAGSGRSLDYLRQSILDPSADIPQDYEGVTVITPDGKRIIGVRVNEDTFTVHLRDMSQNFRMFLKSEVRDVIHEKNSLMPPYSSLSTQDLDDLLAYLSTLRGAAPVTGVVKKTEGPR